MIRFSVGRVHFEFGWFKGEAPTLLNLHLFDYYTSDFQIIYIKVWKVLFDVCISLD